MKKAITIVTAVAGYCLLEVVLLFSIVTPWAECSTSETYQTAAIGAQLLLIPGMAAVFSRLMYGPRAWRKRVLTILALNALGLPVLFGLLIAIGIVLDRLASIKVMWALVAFVFISLVLAVALFSVLRRMRKRGVQLEAARWLSEHQSGTSPEKRRWRDRAIRYSLWIPSLTVLLVLLFLPEVWGVASHHFRFRAYPLDGYRVEVPATWIILQQGMQSESGSSYISGLAGRGMGFSVRRYVHWWEIPLSGWSVQTLPHTYPEQSDSQDWTPEGGNVIARREVLIGRSRLTCVDYWPSHLSERGSPQDSSIAYVRCYGSDRLYADFYDDRTQLPAFYRMLEGIKQEKP